MHLYELRNAPCALTARRLMSLIATTLLLAPLAGCGGDSGSSLTQPPPPPPPATGAIAVTTSTTGAEPDADGYTVAVDGGAAQTIGAAGSLTLPSLSVGSHTVTLAGVAGYCAVHGDSAQTVNVVASDTVAATFAVDCEDGTIVFASNRQGVDGDTNYELYVIRPDGTGLVQLTATQGFDNQMPRWSPDGSKIAFTSDRDGNTEIYVLTIAGGEVTRLTNDPGLDEYPSWSPDGEKIIFDSDSSGTPNIYEMDASDGGNVRALTADTAYNVWPAWSPDGAQIAFVIEAPVGSLNIFTMASNGSGRQQLTHDTNLTFGPSWSPGGGRLAYCVDGDIYVMNSDGSQPTYVTTGSVSASGISCFLDWGPVPASTFAPTRIVPTHGR